MDRTGRGRGALQPTPSTATAIARTTAYKQYGGVADIRYTHDYGSFYLNLSADDQHVGLPGSGADSPSEGIFNLITDRRGAFTPFDFADKQGQNGTIGLTHMLAPGVELIVDGGVRKKQEQAQFFLATRIRRDHESATGGRYQLTTSSFTPRVKVDTS